jgi:hypothetical protein
MSQVRSLPGEKPVATAITVDIAMSLDPTVSR